MWKHCFIHANNLYIELVSSIVKKPRTLYSDSFIYTCFTQYFVTTSVFSERYMYLFICIYIFTSYTQYSTKINMMHKISVYLCWINFQIVTVYIDSLNLYINDNLPNSASIEANLPYLTIIQYS